MLSPQGCRDWCSSCKGRLLFTYFFDMFECFACTYFCVLHVPMETPPQKKYQKPWKRSYGYRCLSVTVWVLGSKLRFSGRVFTTESITRLLNPLILSSLRRNPKKLLGILSLIRHCLKNWEPDMVLESHGHVFEPPH